jgi:hypothetical protein
MEALDRAVVSSSISGVFLGPAVVRGVMDRVLLVEIDGSLERAQLALAYPYCPAVGDVVLVLGQESTMYVFGVIEGRGLTRLDFPGNVELRAAGHLRIEGGAGLELDSTRIAMRADRLDVAVRTVREHIVSLYRRVEGTIRTVAGREKTTIAKQSILHAGRIVHKASDDVIVDGRQIKLG